MAVTSATQTPAATAPPVADATATGRARLADNFETFLSLLTAQLRHQDPLSPMDSTQFTQQLVQMTGVEQQLETNDLLKQLVSNGANGISTAVSLIGKEVRAVGNEAKLRDGAAEWTYKLGATAADVKVEILDSNGKVVHVEAPTDRAAGDHTLTWNGKGLNGAQLPDGGTYTLRVTAVDGSGATVPSTNYIRGLVTGVEQTDGSTFISINGSRVDWQKVTSINVAPTVTPPATPAAT
jgi:flagellar basal-body rod modification protein FlgD